MKRILFVLLTIVTSACSKFSMEEAQFVAFNSSPNTGSVVVNARDYPVVANRSTRFTVPIQVPTNPVGNNYGPDPVDKQIYISVAFRDAVTGKQTVPIQCTAGAKLVTNVTYQIQSGTGYLSCYTSY